MSLSNCSYYNNITQPDEVSDVVECFICAEPCSAICIFTCGHYTCYSCGLRIHVLNEGGCPVCRIKGEEVIITRAISCDEDHYSEKEMARVRSIGVHDRMLKCVIDGDKLAAEIAKLYEYLCPMEGCWCLGEQDPFVELSMLKDHLAVDHKMSYCEICLQSRPAFLCEQVLYGKEALQQHMEGRCVADSSSFTGHPLCKFCTRRQNAVRFYDGEALLKHMQERHYTCDVCNRGQFIFTFFDNRNKLDQHFTQCHKICEHPDCASLDLMLRVFANDIDLAVHRNRTHGNKSRLVFTPETFGAAPPSLGAGLASGGNVSQYASSGGANGYPSAPATSSNANVIQITFDHVFRRETVEMLPTKTSQQQRSLYNARYARGGPASGGKARAHVHASGGKGLPGYYRTANSFSVLQRPRASRDAGAAVHTDPTPDSAHRSQRNSDNSIVHTFAMPVSMTAYTQKHHIPPTLAEQERCLSELIKKHVTSPVTYAHFRAYTKDFTDAKLLTSEYYDLLVREIFPKTEAFNEVFPLLVATVPNPSRKLALQEVWKMRMAPELLRQARAREQEELEAQEKEEREREAALWRKLKTGNTSSGKPQQQSNRHVSKKNAWFNASSKVKLQRTCALSHCESVSEGVASQNAGQTKPQNESDTMHLKIWSEADKAVATGGTLFSSTPNYRSNVGLGTALGSADLFPALPRNDPHPISDTKKKSKRLNAWLRK